MADVISATVSVIAIVEIAEKIIGTCKRYIIGVKEAPHDLHVIVVELTALKTILETLNSLASWNIEVSNIVNGLVDQKGPIEGCLHSIKVLEQLLPSELAQIGDVTSPTSKKRKTKAALATLAWPLKASKATKLLEEISRYKETINLALTAKSMQDVEYIKTKTFEISERLTDSHRQDVYRWLHHTDPSSIHYHSQKNFEPGTCDWILRIPCWTEWLQTKIRCLWIHGIPGSGKTVLMPHLIQRIEDFCDQSTKRVTYVYYYCYFGHNQDEAEPFLRWLLCQLCRKAEKVPSAVYEMYTYGGQPSLTNLLVSLESILQEYEVVYVALDAIDESKPAKELLEVLRELAIGSRFKHVQLLASSRYYADIVNVMSAISSSIPMANEHVKEDIKILVQSMLGSNPKFKHWPRELLNQVEEILPKRAQGMFRWTVCQVDAIQRIKPERRIVERVLANLPKTLYGTYDRIFARIPEEDRVVVHHTLHWISFHSELRWGARIPLEILLQALGKSLSEVDNQQERFLDKDTLLELCGCLITISSKDLRYEEEEATSSVVWFAHYTVLEYLESSSNSVEPISVGTHCAYDESLQLDLLKIVLTNLQDINRNSLPDDGSGFTNVIATVYGSFCLYCVMLFPFLLSQFLIIVTENEVLYDLALSAIDPTKPHYKGFTQALTCMDRYVPVPAYAPNFVTFWQVEWRRFYQNTPAPRLFNLLCIPTLVFGPPEQGYPLATKLLERNDMKTIFQTRLSLALPVEVAKEPQDYNFDGSIIEIFAQIADVHFNEFQMLIEHGSGSFDPSNILLLYIGSHTHADCKANDIGAACLIDRLLGMGAKVNNKEYHVTPLQMAVACWDVDGVKTLLKAGADPNEVGNGNVAPWEDGSRMSRFNHIVGLRPFHICSRLNLVLHEVDESVRAKDLPELKGTLIQYGAEECTEESSDEDEPGEAEPGEAEPGEAEPGEDEPIRALWDAGDLEWERDGELALLTETDDRGPDEDALAVWRAEARWDGELELAQLTETK